VGESRCFSSVVAAAVFRWKGKDTILALGDRRGRGLVSRRKGRCIPTGVCARRASEELTSGARGGGVVVEVRRSTRREVVSEAAALSATAICNGPGEEGGDGQALGVPSRLFVSAPPGPEEGWPFICAALLGFD
jgi:hypothetical protein